MKKYTRSILLAIVICFLLPFYTGCRKNNVDTNQATSQQNNNTSSEMNKAIYTYSIVTKNTSRILGNNAEQISLSTSCMIWPATEAGNRPKVVLIAPSESWQIQLITVDLIHHPSDGPLLVTSKNRISKGVLSEIERLGPIGTNDGIKIITVGMSDSANKQLSDLGYKVQQINGENIYKLAEDIDNYYASVAGGLPNSVIVASPDQPEYTMPAGNWIAHMPEPLLYVTKDTVPPETERALGKRNRNANIYILGPETVISRNVETALKKHGNVTRISGDTPYSNAIAFAKFKDKNTGFGWGITMPGHGLLLVSLSQVKESIPASAFSHRGKHAPLLITDTDNAPQALTDYLKQLKPFFKKEPTEGPYNHIFIAGDNPWISQKQQGDLDNLIEIEAAAGNGRTTTDGMSH